MKATFCVLVFQVTGTVDQPVKRSKRPRKSRLVLDSVFRVIGTGMQRSKAWSVVLHRVTLACDSIRQRCTGV